MNIWPDELYMECFSLKLNTELLILKEKYWNLLYKMLSRYILKHPSIVLKQCIPILLIEH